MADNKKYYYMRLKENFFDSDEMIILESMDNGEGIIYSNILLKLYCRSLKYEGRLMFNDRIPFNAEMLSKITRQPVGVVERALKAFEQLSLIDVMDSGAIYMLDIQNYIGKTSTEADRQREYQAKISKEKSNVRNLTGNLLDLSDKSTPELELEIEKEIKEEEEKNIGDILNFWQTNFGVMASKTYTDFEYWIKDFILIGSSNDEAIELIVYALEIAIEHQALNYSYVDTVLKNWESHAVNTKEKALAFVKKNKSSKKGNKRTKKEEIPEHINNPNFKPTKEQKTYTKEELKEIIRANKEKKGNE